MLLITITKLDSDGSYVRTVVIAIDKRQTTEVIETDRNWYF